MVYSKSLDGGYGTSRCFWQVHLWFPLERTGKWKTSRGDWETIKKSLWDGGLCLISILEHTIAMAAKLMLWIIQDDDHTLQHILRAKIGTLSIRLWGHNDFSWVISPGRTLPADDSKLWLNLCILWVKMQGFIVPAALANCMGREKGDAPLGPT